MSNGKAIEEAINLIEEGYARMMVGMFRLRKMEEYQENYNQLGLIIDLLLEDRAFLRKEKDVVDTISVL